MNHWGRHAQQWNRIGAPLRPSPEDVGLFRQFLGPAVDDLLLLGVTPELHALAPRVTAVDHEVGMIRTVWPGNGQGRQAVQGDWLSLPFVSGGFGTVAGDGSLVTLRYPIDYRGFFNEMARVLRPAGRLLLRLFVRPDLPELCEQVTALATQGKIGSFHAFKWRLAMSIAAQQPAPIIAVAEIRTTFNALLPNRAKLALAAGWAMEEIATIDAYAGSASVYSFPTLAQVRDVIPECFTEIAMQSGRYELAERCPILVLELRS